MKFEMRLSGANSHGLLLLGKIISEAATIYEGKNSIQSQSYGPEARGGASRVDIIISDEDIYHPKLEELDLLLVFTQIAYEKNNTLLKKNGILLAEKSLNLHLPKLAFRNYSLPLFQTAVEQFNNVELASLIALGSVINTSKVISRQATEDALMARASKGLEEIYLKAFTIGIELSDSIRT